MIIPRNCNEMSSQGRVVQPDPSEILLSPLTSLLPSLSKLLDICTRCHGINGTLITIRNNSGGHVTCTSQSSRLLHNIKLTDPITQLIATGIQEHVTNHLDQGLFTAKLLIILVKSALNENIHKHLFANILEYLLVEVGGLINDSDLLKIQLDVYNDCHAKKLIQSIVHPKQGVGLMPGDLLHFEELVIDIHKHSRNVEEKYIDTAVQFIKVEGKPFEDSVVVDGVLYAAPAIPCYEQDWSKRCLRKHGFNMRVMLIATSLAGDSGDFMEAVYELPLGTSMENVVIEKLITFAEDIVSRQVDVVLCQKVVHPALKTYFAEHNVLVLERIGKCPFDAAVRLADATEISSFQTVLLAQHVGNIQQISHTVINKMSYLQLSNGQQSKVLTVVLYQKSEEMLNELLAVFKSCLHVLRLTDQQPYCLPGGGCWQSILGHLLKQKVTSNISTWKSYLHCSEFDINTVASIFTKCLIMAGSSIAQHTDIWVDSRYKHQWVVPYGSGAPPSSHCICGAVNQSTWMNWLSSLEDLTENGQFVPSQLTVEQCQVIDCFTAANNAVQTAVTLAKAVIQIHMVVRDSPQ